MEMINSKSISLVIIFCLFGFRNYAQVEKKMMKQAKSYSKALEKSEWKKVLELTYPAIIKLAGGEKRYLQQSKNSSLELERRGFSIDMAELSAPSDTVKDGENILSVIPIRLTFDGPLGKLYSESSLLAISGDEGKTWRFISMSQTGMNEILELFPVATRKLKFPIKKVYQE
tara:strand:- start:487 stop:1002 length:516 start_codon:yes stop_codon:yes gene_type:complete